MSQRITQLFGVRYPIVQADDLGIGLEAAAVASEAGGLGLIGAGSMKPELLRAHIRKLRAATQPFGVNLPLLYKHMDACVEVVPTNVCRRLVGNTGSGQ